MLMCVAHKV